MKIAIDIDGVCRNIAQAIISLYNRDFNDNKTYEDITDWEWSRFSEVDIREFMYLQYPEEIFRYSSLIKDAKDGLEFLAKQGQTMLISHQPDNIRKYTYQWIGFNDLAIRQVILIPLVQNKAEYYFDLLIDDKIGNLEDALDGGRKIICFGQPWNRQWQFKRVSDWLDLIDRWEELIK